MKTDQAEENRLPIKLDSTSNGEYLPLPLKRAERKANQLALEQADAAARPTGRTLREFLNLPQFAGGRIT